MSKSTSRVRSKRAARAALAAPSDDAWVLVHVEFMGCTTHPRLDLLLSHVASSCEGAIARARRVASDPIGWWELYRFSRDGADVFGDQQSGVAPELYLDHRGRVVERPNVKRARARFDSERRKEIAAGVFPSGEHQCEVCHAAQRAVSAALAVASAAKRTRSKR